jgi:hypothetical protein
VGFNGAGPLWNIAADANRPCKEKGSCRYRRRQQYPNDVFPLNENRIDENARMLLMTT